MSRPEVLAFLAGSKACPDDDTPRLILADWLTDHDDPRGEFVRLQCRLARLGPFDPQWSALRRREQELQLRHEAEWLGPLREVIGAWEFRHGLVRITALSDRFQWQAGESLPGTEALAWVEEVALGSVPYEFVSLSRLPWGLLSQINALDLSAVSLDIRDLESLPEPWELPNLRRLTLRRSSLDARALDRLAGSPPFRQLEELDLGGLPSHGVETLVSSPGLQNLVRLNLSGTSIGDPGLQALVRAAHLGRLSVLDLGNNQIGFAGVEALAASPLLAGLTELNLDANRIGDTGLEALARSPRVGQLRKLTLTRNELRGWAARALAESPHFLGLTSLDLSRNPLSQGPFRYAPAHPLAAFPLLARLTELGLGWNELGDQGIDLLLERPLPNLSAFRLPHNNIGRRAAALVWSALPRLVCLDLEGNCLGEEGVAALVRTPPPPSLRFLNLTQNQLGTQGVERLVRWTGLRQVCRLDLGSNQIGSAGLRLLALSPDAEQLAELDVSLNQIADAGVQALAASRGLPQLSHCSTITSAMGE